MEPQDKAEKLFNNIILRFKIHKKLRRWRKLAKKSKMRFYRLRQWRETEQNYRNKLKILKEEVCDPLIQSQMITEFEASMMFPSLQSMIQLSQQMHNKIDALLECWDPLKTCLAPTVNSLVSYLKLYKQYSNNFLKTDEKMQQLQKRPKFKNVVSVSNIQDLLSKPFQRPLQYKLLISEYMKEMPSYHIDHQPLEQALKALLKISNEINQFVESQLRSQKMVKLQKQFGDILQSSRVYKSSFFATHIDTNLQVYVFNDLLLIAKHISESKQQKYMRINLSPNSFVIKKSDGATHKNMLFVCGATENIHLEFNCSTDQNNAYEVLTATISELYQKHFSRLQMMSQFKSSLKSGKFRNVPKHQYKWKEQPYYNLNLQISVIGFNKRIYPPNNEELMFVLKIELGRPWGIYQIAYYSLDHLKDMQNDIRKLYPKMKIPHLEARFKGSNLDDFKNNIERYSVNKAMAIQATFNYILRSKQIRMKPELILYKLDVFEAFWQYVNKFSHECQCDACLDSQIYVDSSFYQKQRDVIRSKKHQFCIMKSFHTQKTIAQMTSKNDVRSFGIQMKLLWANCVNNHIEQSLLLPSHCGKPIQFAVHINSVGQEEIITIKTTTQATVRTVIEEICTRIGLKTTRDLMLTYEIQKQVFYMSNDEHIINIAKYILELDEKQVETSKIRSFFRKSTFSRSTSMGQELQQFEQIKKKTPKIILRKAINFSWKLEEKTCENNYERYPIVLGQILYRFKNQLMPLNIGDIKILCAFFYTIEEFSTLSMSKRLYFNEEKLRKYIPEHKRNFVTQGFIDGVKQIIQNQMKVCDKVTYLYRCVLRQFGEKTGWVYQFFRILNIQPATLIGGHIELLMGLSSRKFIVTQNNVNAILLDFGIRDLNYRTNGNRLSIITQEKTYEFYCENIYLFEVLLQIYHTIAKFQQHQEQ